MGSTPPTWEIVPAPDAPAGATDPTRRWAIHCPDGQLRWPGLTRGEATTHLESIDLLPPDAWDTALAVVELPAVLSDGAGPHLIGADGEIAIVIVDHPTLEGAVTMGGPGPEYTVGLVAGRGDPPWHWLVRVRVAADDRTGALTALDGATATAALDVWRDQWGGG